MQRPSLFSFRGFFKLTRVWNLFIVLLTQVFTAVFLLHKQWDDLSGDPGFLLVLLTTVIIAAGGYVINDYYDVKIDFINKPDRVVVGKQLKRRSVMVFHVVLNGMGLLGGLLVSWEVLLLNAFSISLLWLYSNRLKRLPLVGNLSIGLLTALTLLVVGVYYSQPDPGLMVYSGFAFFFTLIREIVKDLQDMRGDEAFGCRTLPIVFGVRNTKRFIYFLIMAFTALLWIFSGMGPWYWVYFLSLLTLVEILLSLAIFRADTVLQYGMVSQLCKIIMLGGILTMTIN